MNLPKNNQIVAFPDLMFLLQKTKLINMEDDNKMKAIVSEKYGSPDVLKFKEIQKPTPGDNEVLIKVHAAAANAGDWHLLRGEPFQ